MSKRIGITIGCYDLFHVGHQQLFTRARAMYDFIFVGVHSRESIFHNKRVITYHTTSERMNNVHWFLHPFPHELFFIAGKDPSNELEKLIQDIKIRFPYSQIEFFRGDDWLDFPGRSIIESNKITICFLSYTQGISSTLLRKKMNET